MQLKLTFSDLSSRKPSRWSGTEKSIGISLNNLIKSALLISAFIFIELLTKVGDEVIYDNVGIFLRINLLKLSIIDL